MLSLVQAAVLCLGAVGAVIAMLVNSHQPMPYMDEIFHIPQAQVYCSGNFSHWDPMITTLPGLYFSSLAWLSPFSKLLGMPTESLCVPVMLRAQNLVFSLLLLLCLNWLHRMIHHTHDTASVLSSFNLSTFPVLFFFSFLYYTDVGATLLVLLGYALTLQGNHLLSATVLLCAVCFRQTSIVWLVFVAGTAGVKIIEPNFYTHSKERDWLLSYPLAIVGSLFSNFFTLLTTLWSYLLVVLAFIGFVFLNGSLVVGDKSSHTASFHVPQLFYFALFSCLFSSPHLLFNVRLTLGLLKVVTTRLKWTLGFIFITLAGAAAVYQFTYAHPYLLADNRHYPFYLWKNVFRAYPLAKYWLLPLYSLSVLCVIYALSRTQSVFWVLLYTVCCFTALVPQGLLEFRYYIVPYLLYRLHMPHSHGNKLLPLLSELLLYTAINAFTLYVFLYKPFLWPDSDEVQRFMW